MTFLLDIFNWFSSYPQNLFGNLQLAGFFIMLVVIAILSMIKASTTLTLLVLIPTIVVLTAAQMLPPVVTFLFGALIAYFLLRGLIRIPQN